MAETLQRYRNAGIPIAKAMPKVFAAIHVSVSISLDFTDDQICGALQIAPQELLSEDWRSKQEGGTEPFTQTLGRAVFSEAIEVIFVPSAVDKTGKNMVVFPEVLQPGSIISAEGL